MQQGSPESLDPPNPPKNPQNTQISQNHPEFTRITQLTRITNITGSTKLCENFIEKVYESDDFNNVTMAYEDDSQVRFTSSSLHHPVKN